MGVFLLEILFEAFFRYVCYLFGYFPVFILSLGSVEPAPIETMENDEFYRSVNKKWWHITYRKRGHLYLGAEYVALTGLLCVIGVTASVAFVFHYFGYS